jgi:CheY-like chemotaxis protein
MPFFPSSSCSSHLTASYQSTEVAVTSPRVRRAPSSYDSPLDPPIGNVIITVTDSGPGLSLEQQQALFHQGVQFNPNQLQAGQGSGLGLWISKEIVGLHRGTIQVTSEGLGCGSTFEVTLPVHLRVDCSPPPPRSMLVKHPPSTPHNSLSADPLSPVSVPGHNPVSVTVAVKDAGDCPSSIKDLEPRTRHVLVVDDSPSNRKLVCRLLRSKGFVCHEAQDGAECVEKVLAGEYPYEFILMDYEMPVLDGPSAARRLRDHKCDLLIIGVTGNVLPEDKAHFLDHGANAVLSKPLSLTELLEEIRSHESSLHFRV